MAPPLPGAECGLPAEHGSIRWDRPRRASVRDSEGGGDGPGHRGAGLLERLRAGDHSARDRLIALAQGRFVALARAMLRRYPHVRRWEQTDDLLQAALMRLHRSLAQVRARGRPALRQPGGGPDPPGTDRSGPPLSRSRGARGQPSHRRDRPRRSAGPGRRRGGQARVAGGLGGFP